MLVKAVLLFLAIMVAIAWIGGWVGRLRPPRDLRKLRAGACPSCGRPRIGKGACPCGRS